MKQTIEIRQGPQRPEIIRVLQGMGHSAQQSDELAEMLVGEEMARRVSNSYFDNTRVRFPSRKMGLAVICESFSVEYAYCLELEHDADVLWYSTQPTNLVVSRTLKDGRTSPHGITPDFLVVRTGGACFVETKPEEHLAERAATRPADWDRSDDGRWRYVPGETNSHNLPFEVVSGKELSRIAIQNIEVLHPTYLERKTPDAAEIARLHDVLREWRELTLENLRRNHGFTLALLYQAILAGDTHCLLDKELLTNAHRFRLYSSAERAETARGARPSEGLALSVGETLLLGDTPWTIIGLNRDRVTISNEQAGVEQILRSELPPNASVVGQRRRSALLNYRDDDIREAYRRHELVRLWSLRGHKPPKSKRATFYRWKAEYKKAEEEFGDGLVGLIPDRFEMQGKRNPGYPSWVLGKMTSVLDKYYHNPIAASLKAAYGQFCTEFSAMDEARGIPVPSYETFRRLKEGCSATEGARARYGKRVANKIAPTLAQTHGEKPIRGLHPWHILECDHTPADLQLVDENGQPLHGQTWLTVIVDTFSNMPIVWRLSVRGDKGEPDPQGRDKATDNGGKKAFNPAEQATPSARRLSSLLREMAYQHGRFPTRLHVDNGSDFRSTAIETALSSYGVIVSNRGPGNPRRGPVVESFFRSVNTGLFHRLAGNKEVNKYFRSVTKSVHPATHARYTLEMAHAMLDHWMIDIYPNSEHTGIHRKPADAYAEGMANLPSCISVDYDDRLKFQLTTEAGVRKMQPGKGVHVNGAYYWETNFDLSMYQGAVIPIRLDEWDKSIVWVKLGSKWLMAKSSDYAEHSKLDERDRRTLSEEKHCARVSSLHRKAHEPVGQLPDVPKERSARGPSPAPQNARTETNNMFEGLDFGEQQIQEAA